MREEAQAVRTQSKSMFRRFWIVAAWSMLAMPTGIQAQPVLEEIIVTATKRAESAQSLPLSVSSISGDELRERA